MNTSVNGSPVGSLRVAIVGCGKIADDHAETLGFMDGVEVVACCDLTYLMAEQLATRFEIDGVYDDFDRLLAEQKPDVVHITTPPQSHMRLKAGDTPTNRKCAEPLMKNIKLNCRLSC